MLYILLALNPELGMNGLVLTLFPELPPALKIISIIVIVAASYLLGSVNSAVLVSKTMYGDDIRKYGSGNAGFTNVMRTFGTKAAVITFMGDLLKTLLSILIGWILFGYIGGYIGGLACMVGHIFPVFFKGKGGKGVVCFATILLLLDWRLFLIELVLFIGIVAISKYISLGSVLCAMTYPLFLYRMQIGGVQVYTILLIAIAMATLIVIKHKDNIKRIMEGKESKFSFKKSKKSEEAKTPETDGDAVTTDDGKQE